MKRAAAIIGAVAMVVVAFVVRGIGDDDGSGDNGTATTHIICPRDLREVCEQIDGVDVEYEQAGDTAEDLIATEDANALSKAAWVVPAAWAEAVLATRDFNARSNPAIDPDLFVMSEPVASTGVALAYFEDSVAELGCSPVSWVCLADNIGGRLDVGSPELSSGTGLSIAAAQLVQIQGSAEFDPRVVRLPAFERSSSAFRDMRTRGPAAYAAVGTTTAEGADVTATNTNIPITVVRQNEVRIDLVILTRRGESLPTDTVEAIVDAYLDAGWDSPGSGPSGMPNGDLLNVIRKQDS